MAAARVWAATRFPYLASALFGVQVTAEHGPLAYPLPGGMCVDEHWRLRADPAVTATWTPAQLGSVLVHHVCHLLRDHSERARSIPVTPDDSPAWNRAADAEINDDLVPAGLDLPGDPVLPHHLGAEPGKPAEQYFAAQADGQQEGAETRGAGGNEPARYGNCGSGADGMPRDGEGESTAGGLDQWRAELLRRQVAQDVLRHGKEAGTVPAGLMRWAAEVLTPRVDWRRVLAAELRRAIADVAGAVDYSYRRPSRRAAAVKGDGEAGWVVLPSLRRPVPEVAVVCDTSGSMTEDLLAMALAEVEGLLRGLGLARTLRVLACDSAVECVQRVTSVKG
jgi:predicted metal-dependent peptidase